MADPSDVSRHLAENLRRLREVRGLTQGQLSKMSGVPRATWTNLESGSANPTLAVLTRVASTLQLSIEELISSPKAVTRLYRPEELTTRPRPGVTVRPLLPDPLPGLQLERMELAPGARMTGVPHTPGTREYLTCERGQVVLHVAGQRFALVPREVLVFRGDQRHSYQNPGDDTAVAYSAVLLAPLPA